MISGNTFIVEEANIALRIGGKNGVRVWIGGCAQRLTLNKTLTEAERQIPGRRFTEVDHVDEAHAIEIENVWLQDTAPLDPIMPELERGRVYTLVISWKDGETGYFNKRTYYGVTGQAQRVGPEALQNLTYRAQRMVEWAADDLEVVYVDGAQKLILYSYNAETAGWVERHPDREDLVPALAEIKTSAAKLEIFIANRRALLADSNGVAVKRLSAAGFNKLSVQPRLEFWVLGVTCATLTQEGWLAVGNAFESPSTAALAAAAADGFPLAGEGDPYGVLGEGGLYALGILETLNLTPEVFHVDGVTRVSLYTHDSETAAWTRTAAAAVPALGEIVVGATGVEIFIDGVKALRADDAAGGVAVNGIEPRAVVDAISPRLEFELGGQVVASLSKSGLIGVEDTFELETEELAAIEDAFFLTDEGDVRRAAINAAGLHAEVILEETP